MCFGEISKFQARHLNDVCELVLRRNQGAFLVVAVVWERSGVGCIYTSTYDIYILYQVRSASVFLQAPHPLSAERPKQSELILDPKYPQNRYNTEREQVRSLRSFLYLSVPCSLAA